MIICYTKGQPPLLAKPVAEALRFLAVMLGGVFDSALDNYDGSSAAQNDIYQRIIQFRKDAKGMPEDERTRLEKRIAALLERLGEEHKITFEG